MSFVDLMANDVWSDLDIDNRVQAIIRGQVSQTDELKAARLSRDTKATTADKAFIKFVDSAITSAVNEGTSARADMQLLSEVFVMETANRRLSLPVVEPVYDEEGNITNQNAIDADELERIDAQEVLDAATDDAKDLFNKRNPPAQEPEQVPDSEVLPE